MMKQEEVIIENTEQNIGSRRSGGRLEKEWIDFMDVFLWMQRDDSCVVSTTEKGEVIRMLDELARTVQEN
jgi:hypothetical protein